MNKAIYFLRKIKSGLFSVQSIVVSFFPVGLRGDFKLFKYLLPFAFYLLPFVSISQEKSPYISKVFDYCPAPGQFINKLPEYETGDTKEDMIRKAETCISGEKKEMISLGGYGGFIVFGFDHMVENRKGEKDFRIWGNAFYANTNPNPEASREGGSSEPGIVMVSYDANGNGLSDDPWYELAGSEYQKEETIKNYTQIYYRPDEEKRQTPDSSNSLSDTTYILWKTNQNEEGYLAKNMFHEQSYYPLWVDDDSLTFQGTKLANNAVDESGNGMYYVLYSYPWGYADNHPNHDNRSCFDIDWAVDSTGNTVTLPGIHFVKVYTGVNQYCGRIGETSTEILGAEDLHMTGTYLSVNSVKSSPEFSVYANPVYEELQILSQKPQAISIYNALGKRIMSYQLKPGSNKIPVHEFPKGIYILKTQNTVHKIIKR